MAERDQTDELKKKIFQQQVELRYMHEDNDYTIKELKRKSNRDN